MIETIDLTKKYGDFCALDALEGFSNGGGAVAAHHALDAENRLYGWWDQRRRVGDRFLGQQECGRVWQHQEQRLRSCSWLLHLCVGGGGAG